MHDVARKTFCIMPRQEKLDPVHLEKSQKNTSMTASFILCQLLMVIRTLVLCGEILVFVQIFSSTRVKYLKSRSKTLLWEAKIDILKTG